MTANVDFAYLAEAMSESGASPLSLGDREIRGLRAVTLRTIPETQLTLDSTTTTTTPSPCPSTAETPGPISQSRFLTSLGLQPRLAALLRSAPTPERRAEIESAAKRLVDQTGMGAQYKIMGVVPKGMGARQDPPGVFPFNLD